MTEEQREQLVTFCTEARAFIEGVPIGVIEPLDFAKLTDEELAREADWLDDMLGK